MMVRGPNGECTCRACQKCCEHYPGWMTPDEARLAIQQGFGDRLMCDWREPYDEVLKNDDRIYVLCPAAKGHEGRYAATTAEWYGGVSSLLAMVDPTRMRKYPCCLYKDGMCSVQHRGWKPTECRLTYGCETPEISPGYMYRPDITRLWNTDDGRSIVDEWRKSHGLANSPEEENDDDVE